MGSISWCEVFFLIPQPLVSLEPHPCLLQSLVSLSPEPPLANFSEEETSRLEGTWGPTGFLDRVWISPSFSPPSPLPHPTSCSASRLPLPRLLGSTKSMNLIPGSVPHTPTGPQVLACSSSSHHCRVSLYSPGKWTRQCFPPLGVAARKK